MKQLPCGCCCGGGRCERQGRMNIIQHDPATAKENDPRRRCPKPPHRSRGGCRRRRRSLVPLTPTPQEPHQLVSTELLESAAKGSELYNYSTVYGIHSQWLPQTPSIAAWMSLVSLVSSPPSRPRERPSPRYDREERKRARSANDGAGGPMTYPPKNSSSVQKCRY